MTRAEIFEQVQDVLVRNFEIERSKITPAAHLIKDLGIDSLDAIQMAVHIQELTKQRVTEDKLRQLRSVDDVVDMIDGLLRAKESA
jgi:acyl carrier protein